MTLRNKELKELFVPEGEGHPSASCHLGLPGVHILDQVRSRGIGQLWGDIIAGAHPPHPDCAVMFLVRCVKEDVGGLT